MASHRSRRPTSSDSGYSTTSEGPHSPLSDKNSKSASEKTERSSNQLYTRAADHDVSLSAIAKRTNLTSSIGTQLSGIQLAELTPSQRDELALLVSERGVVILRDQTLSAEQQLDLSTYCGSTHGAHIVDRSSRSLTLKSTPSDHGERYTYVSGKSNEWQSDRSFEAKPSSYSIIKAFDEIGDTIWVSQYGLYESLSKPMQGFLDTLSAEHTSKRQYDTILSLRGMPSNRSPVQTHHPAVRTHPITRIKALNVTPGAVTGFSELSSKESEKVLELVKDHLQSSDEHTVRFRWEAGSVAIWDNRCTAHKHLFTSSDQFSNFFETASIGELPSFNARSESRSEKSNRLAKEEVERALRTEEAQRRYNNTPLRRILSSQAKGEQYASSPRKNLLDASPHQKVMGPGTATEPVPELERSSSQKPSSEKTVGNGETTQSKELAKHALIVSKGSPLRRIIQRQASSEVRAK